MKTIKYVFAAVLAIQLASCNQSADNGNEADEILENSEVFSNDANNPHADPSQMVEIREVTVLEVLPTSNYQYLLVSEEGGEFWIAVSKTDIEVGQNYLIMGGMMQENFKSKELDRVFENVTLVSQIVPARGRNNATNNTSEKAEPITDVAEIENRASGTTEIGTLVKSASNYAGKKVQVQGICTKVNENIMSRNWVHINDGTNAGFDFLVTTTDKVEVGQEVILDGVIALDKDFGAGYEYSILLEDAKLIK